MSDNFLLDSSQFYSTWISDETTLSLNHFRSNRIFFKWILMRPFKPQTLRISQGLFLYLQWGVSLVSPFGTDDFSEPLTVLRVVLSSCHSFWTLFSQNNPFVCGNFPWSICSHIPFFHRQDLSKKCTLITAFHFQELQKKILRNVWFTALSKFY